MAVLQRLGANEDLYALVFGESCLNDAVGVVLYRTLTLFLHERVTVGSTFAGILSFMGVFLGSMLIGALNGRPHCRLCWTTSGLLWMWPGIHPSPVRKCCFNKVHVMAVSRFESRCGSAPASMVNCTVLCCVLSPAARRMLL